MTESWTEPDPALVDRLAALGAQAAHDEWARAAAQPDATGYGATVAGMRAGLRALLANAVIAVPDGALPDDALVVLVNRPYNPTVHRDG